MDLNNTVSCARIDSTPIGRIWLTFTSKGLKAINIGGSEHEFLRSFPPGFEIDFSGSQRGVESTVTQILEYLEGVRREFDLSIDWSGVSDFQRNVLSAVYAIPYGETRSYGQIASQIGRPNASRAVGRANATNPIPLVIPCHRVIGADGSLRGYGAGEGIKTKAWLLALEKRFSR
jgi:methylated-DNA-[protein]-cysteine S-methyltransferase